MLDMNRTSQCRTASVQNGEQSAGAPSKRGQVSLTKRELVSLALVFNGSALLEPLLLLFQVQPLLVELVFHLAMTGKQLLFTLLELALLLGNLLLENHLHLILHLLELLLVQSALLLLLHGRVDLDEDGGILCDTHLGELLGTVVLVQSVVGVFLELFHVCADQHLSQLDKVAVLFVVDFDDTPWVATTADLAAIRTDDLGVGTNNGEGDLRDDLLVFCDRLLIVELVTGSLENLDAMVLDVSKNLDKLAKGISRKWH